jgi:hypothetical protein
MDDYKISYSADCDKASTIQTYFYTYIEIHKVLQYGTLSYNSQINTFQPAKSEESLLININQITTIKTNHLIQLDFAPS